MKRKASTLTPIRSREDLLIELDEPKNPQKRTKIICSINDQTCDLDVIREMIKAGANILSVNTAYVKDRKIYEKLKNIRDQLETELEKTIPINMMLQGKIVRVGNLRTPELFLRKGQKLRITQDWKVCGDSRIVSIDQGELISKVKLNDQLIVDYGQISLRVIGIEKDQDAKQFLMQSYPNIYENEESFRDPINIKRTIKRKSSQSQSNDSFTSFASFSSKSSQKKQQLKEKILEQKKSRGDWKQYKCLLCEVDEDCMLRPFKPIFLIQNDESITQIPQQKNESDSDEEIETQITSKDINDFTIAKKLDYDAITISNVSSGKEVKELRFLLGTQSNIQIFARITTKAGVENFEEIMQEADGCLIARAYITLSYQIEDFVQEQHEIIKKCRKMLKPVIIATQILESMVTQTNPTFTEMGDIANVLEEHIDGLMVSGETTYGYHPLKVVEALSRVCKNIEYQHQKTRKFIGTFNEQTDSKPIISVIAESAVDTAKMLNAAMILLFTTTQLTSTTISKLEAPCQIVAVTAKRHIARSLNYINGVTPILLGSLYGVEQLTPRILAQLQEKGLIKKGDFIIIITGQFGSQEGIINQLKILQL